MCHKVISVVEETKQQNRKKADKLIKWDIAEYSIQYSGKNWTYWETPWKK